MNIIIFQQKIKPNREYIHRTYLEITRLEPCYIKIYKNCIIKYIQIRSAKYINEMKTVSTLIIKIKVGQIFIRL